MHRVVSFKDKFTIELQHDKRRYIWRYAYDTEAKAREVLQAVRKNFGKPVGVETDIAANYYRCMSLEHFTYGRLASRKEHWNVLPVQ